MIRDGEHDEIGLEKLKGLLKILPEFDELEMLKNFDGDTNRLGNAEKFLLQLLKVPKYVKYVKITPFYSKIFSLHAVTN